MVKNMTISIFVFALVSLTFAQNKNVIKENWVLPSESNPAVISQEKYNSPALAPGQELFKTDYDYMQNNAVGPMIALADLDGVGGLDPMMTAMARQNAGTRTVRFAYIAFGAAPDNFSAFDETAGTSGSAAYGWGNMQYCEGGTLDGNVLMFAHSNGNSWHSVIDLTNLVPVTPFPSVSVAGNFPSFVYLTDGTIIMNNTNYVFYASTDYGATFDSLFFVGDGDPNFVYNAANTPAELPIFKSDDGSVIATVGGFDGVFTSGNPDGMYWYGSTDGGGTWGGLAAGRGSGTNPLYGQVINQTYAPYMTNFAQVNANVSNDGTTHIVINGYGEGVLQGATDTTNVFPVLYWNSNHQDWISVSMPEMDAPTDGFGNFVTGGTTTRLYSGNAIGQAYPNVSTSDDGRVVFVAWQGFEYTGAIGSTAWRIYPGDGSANTGPIYYTDLYYTWSNDFGETWEDVAILKGDASVMEQYVYLARRIEFDGDQAKVHYMYMEDAIPGAAIFIGQVAGQNSLSNDTRWLYDSFTFTVPGVEDGIVANSFTLEQNYPNPFNPSTKINYTLAERSAVTLKVYDVLGNEVGNLVNTTQEAGKHSVTFDAGNLASGLYIYTLNSGNFTSSRKMMLLK
ncbi:MAG TPA: T9SS type A sorting domain-containing protein [Ignavibacteriaceae bacterium]|nr:T9SS type A sorting domain-containing protein [Ignavibacteriaceae bacterium]